MLAAEELFAIAREKSVEGRMRLAGVVTDLFLDEGELTDVERALMFDILHSLVQDIEVPLRRRLAEKMAEDPAIPQDLIRDMANDEIEIAYPILTKSKVLWDEDLIEIIFHRSLEHQLAITIREDVSEEVSEALVATGEERVIKSLLENQNAKISKQTMEFLVEESKRVNSFQEPLVRREDLPAVLAKRLCLWVSAALRQHLCEKFGAEIDMGNVDPVLEATTNEELKALLSVERDTDRLNALLDSYESEQKLTSKLMLSALEDGLVSLFLAIFQRMAGLPHRLALRIVFEPRGEGLAIACKAIRMSAADFKSVFMLSRQARPMTRKMLKRDLRKVCELYEMMSSESAQRVLSKWQRGSDYLAAIRDLGD